MENTDKWLCLAFLGHQWSSWQDKLMEGQELRLRDMLKFPIRFKTCTMAPKIGSPELIQAHPLPQGNVLTKST